MSWVVMGREFYASWPVRVFPDEERAQAYAGLLRETYETLREVTPVDREVAALLLNAPTPIIANDRAQKEIRERGLDPKAGGLDLTWDAVEVPDGPLTPTG